MKFNYDLYRPKKVIKDAWEANSAYFRAKDVRITPLTKIGDADEMHTSQSTGRLPVLAQRFKRKRLTLNETLPRRKRIFVHFRSHQNKIAVRVNTSLGAFVQQLDALPTKSKANEPFTIRTVNACRELASTIQRNWQARSGGLSQVLLAIMIIGASAGSVHAYINRSHTPTDALVQSNDPSVAQDDKPPIHNNGEKAAAATPEPPPPPANTHATQHNVAPPAAVTPIAKPTIPQPSQQHESTGITSTPTPALTPQNPASPDPPPTAATPPSASEPATPEPPQASPTQPVDQTPAPTPVPDDEPAPADPPDESNDQEPVALDSESLVTFPPTANGSNTLRKQPSSSANESIQQRQTP